MKKICLLFLTLFVSNGGCQTPKDVRLSYIKITPIGNTDAPQMLLYVSMENIDSIAKFDPNENVGFIDKILTNEKTLKAITTFVIRYDYNQNQKWDRSESGWHNISLYDKSVLQLSHDLNLLESRKFLTNLIEILEKNKLDSKVSEKIDQEVLQPIEY